jgi:NADPH:quinone reductase-like Zn-dependent oxidoreductase
MKAMVITDFGGPQVFEAREVERPAPHPNEVLVRVRATSINPVDYKIRRNGHPRITPPAVLGYDVAGVVEEVGSAVEGFAVGDEVYYMPEMPGRGGSYAEYHVADAAIVAHKPANLSFEEAAAVPLAAGTAWDSLITRADLRVGERVLIHGAGGVGSFAVQIAHAAGAYVIVSCSDYMQKQVKGLGADVGINYKSQDFVQVVEEVTGGEGVDLVFDTVGGDLLTRTIPITRPFGRFAVIVSSDASFKSAYRKNLTVHFCYLPPVRPELEALRVLIERGLLRPVIDSVLPLTEVARAHERLEKGGVKGKIVLRVE